MKIRELFSSPEKWTKGCYARTSGHAQIPPFDPDFQNAACYCLIGAVKRCYSPFQETEIIEKIVKELSICPTPHEEYRGIGDWNDDPARTFEEVKDLVDKLDI